MQGFDFGVLHPLDNSGPRRLDASIAGLGGLTEIHDPIVSQLARPAVEDA
jgi:hypothetical protein